MGERKVLSKYYPPDFDPSKLPRNRRPKNQEMNVRMMLPMSIRCNTCGSYIYKGTKFNSRKEVVIGETYLGIPIQRFYFKCTNCKAEITFKTDPQNSDYTVESGANRNFEPWRAEQEEADKMRQKRDAEEMGDTMKSLENKSLDNNRKMDSDARLYELMSLKSRQAAVINDSLLEGLQHNAAAEEKKKSEEEEEEEEEVKALIKSIYEEGKRRKAEVIRRISDEDLEDDDVLNQKRREVSVELLASKPTDSLTKANATDMFSSSSGVRISIIKKKPVATSDALLCRRQNYDSDG